jgi:diguanylate cyclase (GGDEF)-like protein
LSNQTKLQERSLAPIDPVTGLPGGKHFDNQLNRLLSRAAEAGETLAVALLDIQGLKAFNLEHGWAAGDKALRQFAETLSRSVGEGDRLWHLGGDAFVVAMPGRGLTVATRFSDSFRDTVMVQGLTLASFTAGHAQFPEDGRSAKALIRAADARKDGRR